LHAARPEWHVALARARLQAGQKDKARAALEAMLQRFPGNADAKRMLEELANPPPP
jgi:TolA-binding protein